jgi:hypothetical protein
MCVTVYIHYLIMMIRSYIDLLYPTYHSAKVALCSESNTAMAQTLIITTVIYYFHRLTETDMYYLF